MINKTQRTTFEKELQNSHKYNARFYPKHVPAVTDQEILREIQNGTAKVRKSISKNDTHQYTTIEKYFTVPALEAKRERQIQEEAKAKKRASGYNLAYYKACDALARTESHIKAAKIVDDFVALSKQD